MVKNAKHTMENEMPRYGRFPKIVYENKKYL
jgi:hypothetical protein